MLIQILIDAVWRRGREQLMWPAESENNVFNEFNGLCDITLIK